MKNKERYQTKQQKLNKINKKLGRKAYFISLFVTAAIACGGLDIMKNLENVSLLSLLTTAGVVSAVSLGSCRIIGKKFLGNYHKNKELINELNIQEEYENIDEKEKETVKELAKDKELVNVVQYISDLTFDEKRISLLKDVVLNPSIMQFVNKTDDKDCFEKITEYDFNKERLEKETEKAFEIGTKPKQLIKEIKATINEIEAILMDE